MIYFSKPSVIHFCEIYNKLLLNFGKLIEGSVLCAKSTPDNLNLQGKLRKVRVIGNSMKIAGSKEKKHFLLHSEHFNHIQLSKCKVKIERYF